MPGMLLFGYVPGSNLTMSSRKPAPRFSAHNPPKCPQCGEAIGYHQRRTFKDGTWVHRPCAELNSRHHLRETVRELETDDPEFEKYGMAVVALMRMDLDLQRAAALADVPVPFVEGIIAVLMENRILEDGKWCIDSDVDLEDSQHCAIQLTLWILCAQGVVRRSEGPADPSVPVSGGGDPNV